VIVYVHDKYENMVPIGPARVAKRHLGAGCNGMGFVVFHPNGWHAGHAGYYDLREFSDSSRFFWVDFPSVSVAFCSPENAR
jgi:hypothetical protein